MGVTPVEGQGLLWESHRWKDRGCYGSHTGGCRKAGQPVLRTEARKLGKSAQSHYFVICAAFVGRPDEVSAVVFVAGVAVCADVSSAVRVWRQSGPSAACGLGVLSRAPGLRPVITRRRSV